MKLVIYEFKKVISKKTFLIVLVLCLLTNAFLLYNLQNTEDNQLRITYSEEYIEMLNLYSSMTLTEAQNQVDNELLVYEILNIIENFAEADNEELIEIYAFDIENYRNSNPEAYEKAVKINNQGQEYFWKNSFYYDISKQVEYINSYPSFIDEMYSRAKEQSSSSVFGNENSFSYKNLYKTAKDYDGLKNINLSLVNSKSFVETVKYSLTDIFVIAVILLICFYIFGYEREKGLYFLIRCTKFGRLKTIISKLVVLFVLSAVVSSIFLFTNYLINTSIYGGTNLDVTIQSIAEFRNCTISVTTGEFLLLFTLAKIIGAFIISAFFALIFIRFSNSVVIYIVGFSAIGIEYLFYSLIGENSFINLLKYINVFYIFDGAELFGSYLNLNIFSNAVTSISFVLVVFGALFILFTIFSCVCFCRYNNHKNISFILMLFEKLKLYFFKMNGSTSVLKGEFFKFLIQNKMVVLVILLAIYTVISSSGTVKYQFIDPSDVYYKSYMEYLEGDITAEKEDYIFEQQKYFDVLRHRQNEIIDNKELSENTKQAMLKSIDNILNSKGVAFERVKEQYNRLLDLQANGVNARFIDENIYSVFLSSPTREWNDSILLFFILLIAVPCIFTVEYRNRMINIICSTKNGKLQLFIRKFVVLLIITFVSFLTVYIPYLIRFISTYGINSFETPIVCIFKNFQNTDLSIIDAKIFELLYSMLIAIVLASIITVFSTTTQKTILTMVLSTVLIIPPCLAVHSIENLRIGYGITNGYMSLMVVIGVFATIFIAVMITISGMKITGTKIGGGLIDKYANKKFK